MFLVSFYMFLFWASILEVKFIKWVFNGLTSKVVLLKTMYDWSKLKTKKDIEKFLLERKSSTVTSSEWKNISHFKRV